jgi:FkbM family methyltransferase
MWSVKRTFGLVLFGLARALPSLRPALRRWGLRTSPAWFHGRAPVAWSRRTGRRLRLASFAENYLSFELFWRGLDYYEPVTLMLARRLARDTGRFIDAGANIGYYSLMLAAERPDLEIVAFEPHPDLHRLLRANIAANGFSRIRAEAIALSGRTGTGVFHLSRSHMSASLEPDFDAKHAGRVEVPVTTLDDYLAARGGPTAPFLLKLDVEGHEPALLAGAERTLHQVRPEIIAEASADYPPATIELLRRCGYRFRQITPYGLETCAVPAPCTRDGATYLNCLLTTRPSAELEGISVELREQARSIDPRQSSQPGVRPGAGRAAPPAPRRPRAPVPAILPGRWPDPRMR